MSSPDLPTPSGTPDTPQRNSWWGALWFLCIALFVLAVCSNFSPPLRRLLGHIPYLFPPEVTGTVTATGTTGNWTMHVDECESGERSQYFGIAFFDHTQHALGGHINLTQDETPLLSVNTPRQGGSDEITSPGCAVWDVDIRRTNSSYNDIWAMKGHARFDCQYHDPEARVTGDLQFRSCH